MKRNLLLKTALALAIASPLMASAESQLSTGSGSGSASARLDFQVIIPATLYLGVGRGSSQVGDVNGTVDTVIFDFTNNADQVGIAGAVAANAYNTFTGIDTAVPVRVFGNRSQITITATNPANLVMVSGTETIPFSELSVESDNANMLAPGFSGGTAQPRMVGRVTNETANWTYAYANSTAPGAGTYQGTVTYTAAMP